MIEEETAKSFRDNSPVKDKAATRSARFFIGYLCCRKKLLAGLFKIRSTCPDSSGSLDLLFLFYQEKRKRPPPVRRKRSLKYAQYDIQTKIKPIFKDLSTQVEMTMA
jgi:hypothetical protein